MLALEGVTLRNRFDIILDPDAASEFFIYDEVVYSADVNATTIHRWGLNERMLRDTFNNVQILQFELGSLQIGDFFSHGIHNGETKWWICCPNGIIKPFVEIV